MLIRCVQTPIGKVDEVLGPINQVYFTIKPQEGIVATSFKAGDKVYIGGDKLLPLEKYVATIFNPGVLFCILTLHCRFLPKPKPPPGKIFALLQPQVASTKCLQVLRKSRGPVVLPEEVRGVAEVVREARCAVGEEAHPEGVVDPGEEASAVGAVVSLVAVAEEARVEVSVDAVELSFYWFSCRYFLSFTLAFGRRELLQGSVLILRPSTCSRVAPRCARSAITPKYNW